MGKRLLRRLEHWLKDVIKHSCKEIKCEDAVWIYVADNSDQE